MRYGTVRSAFVLLAAFVVSVAGPVAQPTLAAKEVYREGTQHYEVETDISPEFGRLVARHMEAILGEYTKRFAGYGRVEGRFKVSVFAKEASYLAAVPAEVRGSTGVFVSRERLLAAHSEDRTTEEVLRTLYHEGFHQFLWEAVSDDVPIWLNEGVAEYFSEATWNGRGFTTGLVPSARLHIVREAVKTGTHIEFRDLFRLTPSQWLQNVRTDAHRASLHYSQSWSIVQFLVHANRGRYTRMLNDYFRRLADREDSEDAFGEVFGQDLSSFERSWASYIMSLEPSRKFQCRDNMEAIMLLASKFYEDPRKFKEVSQLRDQVMNKRRYQWRIERQTGEVVSSNDLDQVAALFRCPEDRRNSRTSYVLVRNDKTEMPVLVCNHHPGIVIVAYYEKQPNGEWMPQIEERVREMLQPDLRRAIVAASR